MKILEILSTTTPIDKGLFPNLVPETTLQNALNITYFLAALIAVIAIIVAGFTFTTAAYDPAKAAQAKNAILYSVFGLFIVIIAFVITNFVLTSL